jgi:hypothetical protein
VAGEGVVADGSMVVVEGVEGAGAIKQIKKSQILSFSLLVLGRTSNVFACDGQNFDSVTGLRERIAGVVRLWRPRAGGVKCDSTRSGLHRC